MRISKATTRPGRSSCGDHSTTRQRSPPASSLRSESRFCPRRVVQIAESVSRDGIAAAMRFVKGFGLDMTEEMIGDAVLGLNSQGKLLEGLALMRYRCELYPSSWVRQKLLADRLLEDGDRPGSPRRISQGAAAHCRRCEAQSFTAVTQNARERDQEGGGEMSSRPRSGWWLGSRPCRDFHRARVMLSVARLPLMSEPHDKSVSGNGSLPGTMLA